MKSIRSTFTRSILAALFVTVSASYAMAYDHDSHGWYDDHHHRHAFIRHDGHRGYWDHDKNGAQIFINV